MARRVQFLLATCVLTLFASGLPVPAWAERQPSENTTEKDFRRSAFTYPLDIDNRWTPLIPGQQMVFEGEGTVGKKTVRRRLVSTVTDLKKTVGGVTTAIVSMRDFSDGRLVEDELSFHAQDDSGNVWNLGEYPEEFENGNSLGAPNAWAEGVQGAKAGILMRANPRTGTSSYLEGFAPKIDFADKAKVAKVNQKICVPRRCYNNILIIDESNPLEAGSAHQLKFYAPGVGNVAAEPVNDPEGEVLRLVKIIQLSPSELAHERERALELDNRAERAPERVFQSQGPAERR